MTFKYDYAVFCGRFQPVHFGHAAVIKQALNEARHLIILVGSDHRAQNARWLPFTTGQRIKMLYRMLDEIGLDHVTSDRISIVPIDDYRYQLDRWIGDVHGNVTRVAASRGIKDPQIALIGHSKDASSFYLKKFPEWASIEVSNFHGINATTIRQQILTDGFVNHASVRATIGDNVAHYLIDLIRTGAMDDMIEEWNVLLKYWDQWKDVPYPVNFNTVDSLVTQSGHILVVKRRSAPGKGNLALPGGFVNTNETLTTATIRELREETKLAVPKPVLLGSIQQQKIFDDPNRSSRGRTITQATHFQLTEQTSLPKVKGSDDAEKAMWMPLSEAYNRRGEFFEDHWDIITDMVGV